MLKHLSVRNYALIDELNLELGGSLSVITGETGAGKSIILGALNLVLGKRADLKVLRDTSSKCVVEATFLLSSKNHQDFFEKHELDFETETIIRREITPSGKSRAFINDTPVNLSVLNTLSAQLIDVHSQHQNLLLSSTDFQINLLDAYAGNDNERHAYQQKYLVCQRLQNEIEDITQNADRQSIDLDYVNFLLKELTEAQLEAGEQERIEEELKTLEHAEEIQEKLDTVVKLIEGEGISGIGENLHTIFHQFKSLQNLQPGYSELAERTQALQIELEDIRQEAEQRANETEYEPEKLQKLDDRLSQLVHLQRKHGAQSVEDLISKKNELEGKLDDVTHAEERLNALRKELNKAEHERATAAKHLHTSRAKSAPELEAKILSILRELNMKDAQLKIEIVATENYGSHGSDKVVFSFSANKGMAPQPLAKVASGGEMSRVMLALKSIMAQYNELATIIFDEIDTGVSGETAGKIGNILNGMGAKMQVIAITHLPQIGAMGSHHFKVQKQSDANSTTTDIVELNEQERVQELARLLSGERITEAALAHAENLLGTKSADA